VLAGFSLSAIVGLVSLSDPPPLAGLAIVGLVVTASAMIYAMQFLFTALRYWSSPSERLAWRPEAISDPEVLRIERWHHAIDQGLFRRYARRGSRWYNVGITAFSVSIVLLVVPAWLPGIPGISALTDWLTVVVAVAGLIGELLLIVGARVPAIRPRVWPDPREEAKLVPFSDIAQVP
jgi:hypothetical protein